MNRYQVTWVRIGIVGLYIAALLATVSVTGAEFGFILALIAALVDPNARRWLWRDSVVVAVLAAAGYTLVRGFITAVRAESAPLEHIDVAIDWLFPLAFPVMAWWMVDNLERAGRVLLVALTGLIGGVILAIEWSNVAMLVSGVRTGFHVGKPIAFSLYSGAAIVGLIVFAPRWWGAGGGTHATFWRGLVWLAALTLLVESFILSQSRGGWLAGVIVIPVVMAVRYGWTAGRHLFGSWRAVTVSALTLVLVAGILVANLEIIEERVSDERDVIETIVRKGLDSAPEGSVTYRLWLWDFGLEKWSERPWFGWGPGTTSRLIAESGRPELRRPHGEWLHHLHNSYLQLLVEFGLVGAALCVAVFVMVLRGAWRAYRAGRMPYDYAVFCAGTLALTAIWSLFDFRLLHYDWRFYWLLIAGVLTSFALRGPRGGAAVPERGRT